MLISGWTVVYVLALGSAYHFGNFSHPGYEKSMAGLIDELEKNYILRDYKEIDFDALRAEYLPMAAEAEKNKDEEAFAEAVANLCYEFHDGHLSMRITDDELSAKVAERLAGNDYGFSMIRKDDGKTVVILADEAILVGKDRLDVEIELHGQDDDGEAHQVGEREPYEL